jgi:hypothetical protein
MFWRGFILQLDVGAQCLAIHLVGDPEDRAIAHAGMLMSTASTSAGC